MERSPKTVVIDASAASKWFVEEEHSDKADLLKAAHETGQLRLAAPDLLVYEVTNALQYNPKMTTDDLVSSVRRLLELDLDLIPPRADLSAEIARTTKKYALSAYDASYVALADMMGTNCVTADAKLHKKLQGKKRLFLLDQLRREWDIPGESVTTPTTSFNAR